MSANKPGCEQLQITKYFLLILTGPGNITGKTVWSRL